MLSQTETISDEFVCSNVNIHPDELIVRRIKSLEETVEHRYWIEICPASCKYVCAICNKCTHTVICTCGRQWLLGSSCKTNRQVMKKHELGSCVFLTQIRPRVIHCPCVDAVHRSLEITFCSYFTRGGGITIADQLTDLTVDDNWSVIVKDNSLTWLHLARVWMLRTFGGRWWGSASRCWTKLKVTLERCEVSRSEEMSMGMLISSGSRRITTTIVVVPICGSHVKLDCFFVFAPLLAGCLKGRVCKRRASLWAGSLAPAWGLGSLVGGSGRTRGFWGQSGLGENLDQLGTPQRGRGLDFEPQLFDHQRRREPASIFGQEFSIVKKQILSFRSKVCWFLCHRM